MILKHKFITDALSHRRIEIGNKVTTLTIDVSYREEIGFDVRIEVNGGVERGKVSFDSAADAIEFYNQATLKILNKGGEAESIKDLFDGTDLMTH